MHKLIEVVRTMILDSRDRVLFLQRDLDAKSSPGFFCLPGGKVEKDQTIEQTIRAEVFQETNLNLLNLKPFSYESGQSIHKTSYFHYYFTARPSGMLTLSRDCLGFGWFNLEELTDYDIAFGNREMVQKYFQEL